MGSQQVSLKQKDFEDARNSVKNSLRIKNPVAFPNGTTGVDISDLLVYMFTGSRDCQGFQNPQGSGIRVHEGKGRGWDFVPS